MRGRYVITKQELEILKVCVFCVSVRDLCKSRKVSTMDRVMMTPHEHFFDGTIHPLNANIMILSRNDNNKRILWKRSEPSHRIYPSTIIIIYMY